MFLAQTGRHKYLFSFQLGLFWFDEGIYQFTLSNELKKALREVFVPININKQDKDIETLLISTRVNFNKNRLLKCKQGQPLFNNTKWTWLNTSGRISVFLSGDCMICLSNDRWNGWS